MPKIKIAKSSPSLDMTPMVDLAFLLVTFFMLTTTSFREKDPVTVDTPNSTSEITLTENVMLITVDTTGRVFFSLGGQEVRENMLDRMANQHNIRFTEKEKETFMRLKTFGVPMKDLPAYLDADDAHRKRMDLETKGIPYDTALSTTPQKENELFYWINFGRFEAAKKIEERKKENPSQKIDDLRFAIKADGKTAYKKVKDVINVFKAQDIFLFNLITKLEKETATPEGAK